MAQMIKGETVAIITKIPNGEDDFGQPLFDVETEAVTNVIVGSPTSDDVISEINLSGKTIAFTLGIPKGDTHDWTNACVMVRGIMCRTIGIPTEYTEGNMPSWWLHNKVVKVEHYE